MCIAGLVDTRVAPEDPHRGDASYRRLTAEGYAELVRACNGDTRAALMENLDGNGKVSLADGRVVDLELADFVGGDATANEIDDVDIVFIENVGNLVCPASFDLGQHLNVTLLSTPEGHDKPAKYPVMFRAADLVLITKADLLPVLEDFDPVYAEDCVRQLANPAPILNVSARKGDGLDAWLDWLRARLEDVRAQETAIGAG